MKPTEDRLKQAKQVVLNEPVVGTEHRGRNAVHANPARMHTTANESTGQTNGILATPAISNQGDDAVVRHQVWDQAHVVLHRFTQAEDVPIATRDVHHTQSGVDELRQARRELQEVGGGLIPPREEHHDRLPRRQLRPLRDLRRCLPRLIPQVAKLHAKILQQGRGDTHHLVPQNGPQRNCRLAHYSPSSVCVNEQIC